MILLKGQYNEAKVYTTQLDNNVKDQILTFLNHPAFANTKIAIMPDVHAGKGSVIGFTMEMNDMIIPNIIGVDIGCGVLAVELKIKEINFKDLDTFIRQNIPSGFHVNKTPSPHLDTELKIALKMIAQKIELDEERVFCSVGSLGGGNHFIEIARSSSDENLWLVIHSGSRNFGLKVAEYHQKQAQKYTSKQEIQVPKELEYLPVNEAGQDYIHDMQIAQKMAIENRKIMAQKIVDKFLSLEWKNLKKIETVHNYINFQDKIVRKGAVSAHKGEELIIPFNMRDGSIVAVGKGNAAWNFSAPHGAGRTMSRTQARKKLNLEDFQKNMKGIWTSCVHKKTLDEAPAAYKKPKIILEEIGETLDIQFYLKPVYNFKAN